MNCKHGIPTLIAHCTDCSDEELLSIQTELIAFAHAVEKILSYIPLGADYEIRTRVDRVLVMETLLKAESEDNVRQWAEWEKIKESS